jgi:predicted nucleic acid-binding protein
VEDILDYFCSVGNLQKIFYLWRPLLPDPKDDLLLEVAVAGNCEAIITYNRKDFRGAEQFGIKILAPLEFLETIGAM